MTRLGRSVLVLLIIVSALLALAFPTGCDTYTGPALGDDGGGAVALGTARALQPGDQWINPQTGSFVKMQNGYTDVSGTSNMTYELQSMNFTLLRVRTVRAQTPRAGHLCPALGVDFAGPATLPALCVPEATPRSH